jgi:cytochrome c biogenesis protein CcdA
MLRLIGLVVSIGLADSLNPSTIAPALYLATGEEARARVTEFTMAVFIVYFLGGVIIALGPGQLLLSLLPHLHHRVQYVIEVVVGVVMLVAAWILWRHRHRLSHRELPAADPDNKRSSAILGASITAVELPTAFPYFAAIAAIVGSGFDPARQVVLLVLFNVCFVLPLLLIVGTLALAGDQSQQILASGRDWLQRHWPALLAALALVAGLIVVLLGATGLAAAGHGRFGKLARRLRHLFHP